MLRAARSHILAALPEDDKQSLLQNATREELPPRHTFYSPGMPIRDIFFLEEGMASELVRMSDGRAVDVAPNRNRRIDRASAVLGRELKPSSQPHAGTGQRTASAGFGWVEVLQ